MTRTPQIGDAVQLNCCGKLTLAVFTRFGWRCSCCGEPVKVVYE